jgi:hypothetical protein
MPNSENHDLEINKSTKTMFFFPVTGSEVKKVAMDLKNRL